MRPPTDNGLWYWGRLPIIGLYSGRVITVWSVVKCTTLMTIRFAPTRYRARMIAAVFFCQPIGQLIAAIVAFAATAGFRSHLAGISDSPSCSVFAIDSAGINCARSVDRAWRIVAGLGCVPAAVAMAFRLTIPESVSRLLMLGSRDETHASKS